MMKQARKTYSKHKITVKKKTIGLSLMSRNLTCEPEQGICFLKERARVKSTQKSLVFRLSSILYCWGSWQVQHRRIWLCVQCVYILYVWVRSAWPLDSPADCLSPWACLWSICGKENIKKHIFNYGLGEKKWIIKQKQVIERRGIRNG